MKMEVKFNKEILQYCYQENTDAKGFLTSCKEILIPYMLKKHKNSLKEYIKLSNIEFINGMRTVEIKTLYTDGDIKIDIATFKNIEKELIKPLYNSLKNLNLKYELKIGCYLYNNVKGESNFSGCWKEFRITNYDYQAELICPSLNTH